MKQQMQFLIGKSCRIILILAFLLGFVPTTMNASAEQTSETVFQAAAGKRVYLPLILNGGGPILGSSDLPLMVGVMPGWPGKSTIDSVMKPIDRWITGVSGGRSTSIFATFLTLNLQANTVAANVEIPLTLVWDAGYTPFINLPAMTGDTAAYVATSSEYGTLITNWARSFKNYADGGKRFAYIAPLQEMNGEWVAYGGDPTNYKRAYKRFQEIFAREGVPAQSVKWVFAPNGWSRPGLPVFEDYYPGDENVDVLGVSAYNFGYCAGGAWKEPPIIYNNPDIKDGHYLKRLYNMAPSKPIFVAQTASSSIRNPGQKNAAEKERWLRDAYKYLSNQPNVKAVLYFNTPTKDCDWEIFKDGVGNPGYRDGVRNNGYKYISPSELLKTDHSVQ